MSTEELIREALAAEVASRTQWDEPPAFYFLYLTDDGVRLSQLHTPDGIWAGRRPASVLQMMADAWDTAAFISEIAPHELYAVAFRDETWVAAVPAGPAGEAVEQDARERRLHLRADRVEARAMWAVDRNGAVYGVVQPRGEAPGVMKNGTIGGAVPQALKRIAAIIWGEGDGQ